MIAIGCDHGGLELKDFIAEHLKKEGYEVKDFGIYENKSVDYPDIAKPVCETICSEWNLELEEAGEECRFQTFSPD